MRMKDIRSLLLVLLVGAGHAVAGEPAAPETVRFASADGRTELTGYVFKPQAPGRYPAVVMMHGRAGSYSSLKKGQYDADALTMRHRMWGRYWAERGYVAIHVDSFGPRGFPEGFAKHSYSSRPGEVSEITVRPLDAYGALAYLRTRADVIPDRIGLQGWSNGGMTVLSTMAPQPPGLKDPSPANGFRAALAHYPSCLRSQATNPMRRCCCRWPSWMMRYHRRYAAVSPKCCAAAVPSSSFTGMTARTIPTTTPAEPSKAMPRTASRWKTR